MSRIHPCWGGAVPLVMAMLAIAPASADHCPARENIMAGYVLEIGPQQRLSIKPEAGALVESILFVNGARVQRSMLYEGYVPLEEETPDRLFSLKPSAELGAFFPVRAGAEAMVSATPTILGQDGKPWSIALKVLGRTTHRIGHCAYPVWRISRIVKDGTGQVLDDVIDLYSPDIRFVIAKERKAADGVMQTITYSRVRPRGRSAPL